MLTKNDMINEISANLSMMMDREQADMVKALFMVKMQGYEIHEVCVLPSVEVTDNDYIYKRFVVDMLAKGVKENSIKNYMNIVKAFFKHTKLDYRSVTSQDVTDYLAVKKVSKNVYGRSNSQNYLADICRVLFIFFGWAYKKHHIGTDIMRDVDRIKAKQKKKDRITPEEIEACRECLKDEREKALFELMLSTGLRVGEIARLRIEDISFAERKLYVHGTKTDAADREAYLSIRARNCIRKYVGQRMQGYVFQPSRNIFREERPIGEGTLEKIAKEIGRRAGAHVVTTVHIYRKTFASETYRKTENVKMVSVLLGHASTAITEKYYLVDDMKDIGYQALRAA